MKVFISIISSVIVYGCAALIFVRMLSKSGIRFKNKYLKEMSLDFASGGDFVSLREGAAVFAAAFAFRIFMHLTRLISIVLPFTVILADTAVLILYGAIRNRGRYIALALIYMAVICSVTWVPSGSRYTLCAEPLYLFEFVLCMSRILTS